MGLDISPGGAHWAYSGFHRFRERLAAEEGLVLGQMEGYWLPPDSEMAYLSDRDFQGPARPWQEDGEYITPLGPLLDHSDCDGVLLPYECETVLPRLREIVEKWDAADQHNDTDHDVSRAFRLIEGMEHCVEHGCAMVFH
jgi:hypothetical protein